MNPHHAEHIVTVGYPQAMALPHARRLDLPDASETSAVELQRFLDERVFYSSQSLAMFVDPRHVGDIEHMVERLNHHYRRARIGQNSVEFQAENQAKNFARTLARMAEGDAVSALHTMPSMRGRTCVIVGAGACLDHNIAQLLAHTGPIIAVNTSVGALSRAGIRPSVVLSAESKSIREGMDRNTLGAPVALDATCHPDNWPVGVARHYINSEPNFLPYAQQLGVAQIANGPSCVTLAFGMACMLGASKIVLVGCNFAFTEPGRMYALGTPYEDTAVTIDPDALRITTEGTHKPRDEQDAMQLPGINGEPCLTTYGMASFRDWFAKLPASAKAKTVNCSERGLLIDGVRHADLAGEVEHGTEPYTLPCLDRAPSSIAARLAHDLRSNLRHVGGAADDAAVLRAAANEPLLATYHTVQVLKLKRGSAGTGHRERRALFAETARRGAKELLAAMDGGETALPPSEGEGL